jgi:hypothetical protein
MEFLMRKNFNFSKLICTFPVVLTTNIGVRTLMKGMMIMRFDIENRIKEIINERCINKGEWLMSYKNFYWTRRDGERPVDGFKRVFNDEYKKEFDDIFDEIHAF